MNRATNTVPTLYSRFCAALSSLFKRSQSAAVAVSTQLSDERQQRQINIVKTLNRRELRAVKRKAKRQSQKRNR